MRCVCSTGLEENNNLWGTSGNRPTSVWLGNLFIMQQCYFREEKWDYTYARYITGGSETHVLRERPAIKRVCFEFCRSGFQRNFFIVLPTSSPSINLHTHTRWHAERRRMVVTPNANAPACYDCRRVCHVIQRVVRAFSWRCELRSVLTRQGRGAWTRITCCRSCNQIAHLGSRGCFAWCMHGTMLRHVSAIQRVAAPMPSTRELTTVAWMGVQTTLNIASLL